MSLAEKVVEVQQTKKAFNFRINQMDNFLKGNNI